MQKYNPLLAKEWHNYDIKQSDNEAPLTVGLWGVRSTPSLLSLTSLLRLGVVAPDSLLYMGQIKLFDIKPSAKKWHTLDKIAWNRTVWSLTVCKQMTDV